MRPVLSREQAISKEKLDVGTQEREERNRMAPPNIPMKTAGKRAPPLPTTRNASASGGMQCRGKEREKNVSVEKEQKCEQQVASAKGVGVREKRSDVAETKRQLFGRPVSSAMRTVR